MNKVQVIGKGGLENMKAFWLERIDPPKVHPEAWKDLIQDPDSCEDGKKVFRDKLPVEEYKDLKSSDVCMGFYCEYQIQAIRAFYWCSFFVVISVLIVLYYSKTIDVATGFTVGAYFVAVFALFLALIGFVLASTRRRQ
jgi:hypothetical protein